MISFLLNDRVAEEEPPSDVFFDFIGRLGVLAVRPMALRALRPLKEDICFFPWFLFNDGTFLCSSCCSSPPPLDIPRPWEPSPPPSPRIKSACRSSTGRPLARSQAIWRGSEK